MVPFLKQVAEYYYAKGSIDSYCFVFPNRRALNFFKKYLAEAVCGEGVPVVAPKMYSMDDFIYHAGGLRPTDKVHLLLELYECYKKLNPNCESLDNFIFWGDVILGDFDDVDKYMVDAKRIFTNVAEFNSMNTPDEYFSKEQKEAVETLIGHLSKGGKIKEEFRRIWDILFQLYEDFRQRLEGQGLSYPGQVYRKLAEALDLDRFQDAEKYVFVGLNALNECEKKILSKLRDAHRAEFIWDYSHGWIDNEYNRSRVFLEEYSTTFRAPEDFRLDEGKILVNPKINVVSVPSNIGQTKLLPQLLNSMSEDTAIVIPDENLLIPVLNSIPEQKKDINVTMGYPVSGSQMWSLMNDVAALQMHIRRQKDKVYYFYHRQVLSICSNSVILSLLSEEEREMVDNVRKAAKYYIPQSDFDGIEILKKIFRPVALDYSSNSPEQIRSIEEYQRELVSEVAVRLKSDERMALELDFAKEYYLAIGRLSRYELPVIPATYFRLLKQLFDKTAVPFEGEPIRGLQIMGPLETRCLDFENLIILSCNEGVFPKKTVSSSFMPPELRKGFGLPTYEYQDVVWAYYFYRMIRRASNVWMIYNSCSDGLVSGEQSRYIKQLEMHLQADVCHYVAGAPVKSSPVEDEISKTKEMVDIIKAGHLSPSAISSYNYCQAMFYYQVVEKLRPDQEAEASLQANDFGTVFHNVMEQLYNGSSNITREMLEGLIKDRKTIAEMVEKMILDQLKTIELTGKNIIYKDVICRYVENTLKYDLSLLEKTGRKAFRIVANESKGSDVIDGFKFVGRIDRIDDFGEGKLRVVDYKTGGLKDKKEYESQLYIYRRFMTADNRYDGNDFDLVIYHVPSIVSNGQLDYDCSEEWLCRQQENLSAVLAEISDVNVPFKRAKETPESSPCENCDFKTLCGR